ncbi:Hint domain-containing protein [Aliiroseovarius sp. YM-037]|uniref:Hint domain-containing protein n=1 Tax=Aliiroseovarius sp. YM-037 TaxID=3341728 RepID=UPI003A8083A9
MPIFFGYDNAIFGSQSTVNGSSVNYAFGPATGSTWRWTGTTTNFAVKEADHNAVNFNGDASDSNEQISPQLQIGAAGAQTVEIDGTDRQVIYDYAFEVSGGGNTYEIAVIDVDLDNSDAIGGTTENGYYLVFLGTPPPPNTNLTVDGIVKNWSSRSHNDLGGTAVCFASGTLIETERGPQPIENLAVGDRVLTADAGLQAIRWIGSTTVPAIDKLAPVVISKGTLGNTRDLVVSPQHGVVISDWRAELFFAREEVLVRAIDLVDGDRIYRRPGGYIQYFHLLLDQHRIIYSEGIPTESLFLGEVTLGAVGDAAREELLTLFPEIADDPSRFGAKAIRSLRAFEARCLPPLS